MQAKTKSVNALLKRLSNDSVSKSFLLCAVETYSKQVLADKSDWSRSLINKALWDVIAKQNLEIINETAQ